MDADECSGRVTKIRIYNRVPGAGEWTGSFSLLCLRIEAEGKPRDMSPPNYIKSVFCGIEGALPRELVGSCELGYYLVEYKNQGGLNYLDKSMPRSCFSLPRFGEGYAEICSDQLRSEIAKKYIGELVYEFLKEFPGANIEVKELLD